MYLSGTGPKSTNQKGKYLKNNKIKEYNIYETAIKAGSSKLIWLWLAIEPIDKEILATDISKKRNISIAKLFLSQVVNKWITCGLIRWRYFVPQACCFLKLKHRLHFSFKKSIIERTMQHKR